MLRVAPQPSAAPIESRPTSEACSDLSPQEAIARLERVGMDGYNLRKGWARDSSTLVAALPSLGDESLGAEDLKSLVSAVNCLAEVIYTVGTADRDKLTATQVRETAEVLGRAKGLVSDAVFADLLALSGGHVERADAAVSSWARGQLAHAINELGDTLTRDQCLEPSARPSQVLAARSADLRRKLALRRFELGTTMDAYSKPADKEKIRQNMRILSLRLQAVEKAMAFAGAAEPLLPNGAKPANDQTK